MTDKLTVTLAGEEFSITVPLTLGQLQDLQVAVMLPTAEDPQEEQRRDFKRSMEIMLAALLPENPGLSAEKLMGMRISSKEWNGAVGKILVTSGLAKSVPADGDAPAGEAVAEVAA